MSSDGDLPDRIHHLALSSEWEDAVRDGGPYRRSTLGRSLAEEGFIHCSFVHQVPRIADRAYRGREVVVLVIPTAALRAEVRVENLEGGEEHFPHLYGPLPIDAVAEVLEVPLDPEGRPLIGDLLDRP